MAGTTTGLTVLPDVGVLSYNGVTFSSLYKSRLQGRVVQDDALRTTKIMEWTLQVEGVVTLEKDLSTTDQTWTGLRKRLSVHAAPLNYSQKGFGDLKVNVGGSVKDVAWGPVPEIVHFQPLGQSRAANITWNVVTRIPELLPTGADLFRAAGGGIALAANAAADALRRGLRGVGLGHGGPGPAAAGARAAPGPAAAGAGAAPVLQFSYEYNLTYDERGYAGARLSGVLEIPLTRVGNVRTLTTTVDDFRQLYLDIKFDLSLYQLVSRNFQESRDKRTCQWSYEIKQQAPFGLPVGSTSAHGKMTVKPIKKDGKGLVASNRWSCAMSCTYVVRPDYPRRFAFYSFIALLWFRMWQSVVGLTGQFLTQDEADAVLLARGALRREFRLVPLNAAPIGLNGANAFYAELGKNMRQAGAAAIGELNFRAINSAMPLLVDFSIEEGLYENSDSVSFQAGWILITNFQSILNATGVWKYNQDTGGNVWRASVGDIMGWRGPLAARINPAAEVIVDLGGGGPLTASPIAPE